MKIIINIIKGIGITLAAIMLLILYQCTGPHSPQDLVKEMREIRSEAENREQDGDRLHIAAITNFNSADRQANFKAANIAYFEAEMAWERYLSYTYKLSRYNETQRLENASRNLAKRKISELENKMMNLN